VSDDSNDGGLRRFGERGAKVSKAIKKAELEIIAFASPRLWEKWLAHNHSRSPGVWVRFFKKDSGRETVTYAQALDSALCYGWIDGQVKRFDDLSYLQRFTPRRSRSIWSKRNQEHVQRLTKEGRMKPAGLEQIRAAKHDGRWDAAYDPPSKMKLPDDFLCQISNNKKAKAFFATLNRANIYAIAWRIQTAKKPETREKRMKEILAMLAAGKQFHPNGGTDVTR
jgi:uncharacterized protein YdeI (YjbR/CyaY-like superfamily)